MSLAEELRSRNFSEYLDPVAPNLNLLTLLSLSRHLWTMVSLSRYLPTSCALCEFEYCRGRALCTLLEWLNGLCYLVWWPFNHSPKISPVYNAIGLTKHTGRVYYVLSFALR